MGRSDSGSSFQSGGRCQFPASGRLRPQDERALFSGIQSGLDRLVEGLSARIRAAIDAADTSPFSKEDLWGTVAPGIRTIFLSHVTNGGAREELVQVVAGHVRESVGEFVRGQVLCGCDVVVQSEDWATAKFDPATLETHVPGDSGDEATLAEVTKQVNDLVLSHSRLVTASARLCKRPGVELDDLCQEGVIALRRAVLHYRQEDGVAFSTFATKAIRNHLTGFIRTVSGMTDHMSRKIYEFKAREQQLAHSLKAYPSPDEVCDSLGWSQVARDNVKAVLRALVQQPLPTAAEESTEPSVADRTADPACEAVDREQVELLFSGLEHLATDEREVVHMHHFQYLSFREIALRLHKSEDTVRGKYLRAIRNLKCKLEQGNVAVRARRRV